MVFQIQNSGSDGGTRQESPFVPSCPRTVLRPSSCNAFSLVLFFAGTESLRAQFHVPDGETGTRMSRRAPRREPASCRGPPSPGSPGIAGHDPVADTCSHSPAHPYTHTYRPIHLNRSPGLSPGLSAGLSPGLSPGLSAGLSPGLSPGQTPASQADQLLCYHPRVSEVLSEVILVNRHDL
ncbi:unnamed protein product [Gadus morhua 'NCC']